MHAELFKKVLKKFEHKLLDDGRFMPVLIDGEIADLFNFIVASLEKEAEINSIKKEYQDHLDKGDCTASPEHGCSICLKAQDAGIIPDPDNSDFLAQEYMENNIAAGRGAFE